MAGANPIENLLNAGAGDRALALKMFNAKHTRAMTLVPFQGGDLWKPLSDPPDPLIVIRRSERDTNGLLYALCDARFDSFQNEILATIRPIAKFQKEPSLISISFDLPNANPGKSADGLELPPTTEIPMKDLELVGQASKAKAGETDTDAFDPKFYGSMFSFIVFGNHDRNGFYKMFSPDKTKIYKVNETAGGGTPELFIGHAITKTDRPPRKATKAYPLVASVQVLGYLVGNKIQANRRHRSGVVLAHNQTLYLPWVLSVEPATDGQKATVSNGIDYTNDAGWTNTTSISTLENSILENFVGLGTAAPPAAPPAATSKPSVKTMTAKDAALAIVNVGQGRTRADSYAEETDLERLKSLFEAFKTKEDDLLAKKNSVQSNAVLVTAVFDNWKLFADEVQATFGPNVLAEVWKIQNPWMKIVEIPVLGNSSFKKVYDELSKYKLVDNTRNDPPAFLESVLGIDKRRFAATNVPNRPGLVLAVWLRVLNDMNSDGFNNFPDEWYSYYDNIIDQMRGGRLDTEAGGSAKFFGLDLVITDPFSKSSGAKWTGTIVPRLEKFMKFVKSTKKPVVDLKESLESLDAWYKDAVYRNNQLNFAARTSGLPNQPSDYDILSKTDVARTAIRILGALLANAAKSDKTDAYTYISNKFPITLGTMQTIYGITAPAATAMKSSPLTASPTGPPVSGSAATPAPFVSLPYSHQGLANTTAIALPIQTLSVAIRMYIGGRQTGLFYTPRTRASVFAGRSGFAALRLGPFIAFSVDPVNVLSGDASSAVSIGTWRKNGSDVCTGDVNLVAYTGSPDVLGWETDPNKAITTLVGTSGARYEDATFPQATLSNPGDAIAFGDRGTFLFASASRRLAVVVVHAGKTVVIRGIYVFL
ncbi:MAG: hypothetical protein AB7P49_02030 [Bdellovibrionales bacterium]